MTESYKLIKSNGDELEFDVSDYFLKSLPNFGNPSINYTTQKSFFQDGETITNFLVNPRQLNLPLIGSKDDIQDRMDYWDLRRAILRFLSPVSGAMRFQVTLDDHTVYELINVYPTDGLSMDGNTFNDSRNDGRIDEVLRLTAYDPIWRQSPIINSGSLSPTIADSLSFPISFPISFGASGANFTNTINYTGTWRTYPKITITGPYTTATVTNVNGAMFKFIQAIASNEQRIVDLTDPISGFSVTDQFGNNKIGELSLESNLTQFYILPDTTNEITGSLNNGSSSSRFKVEYYTKYLGI